MMGRTSTTVFILLSALTGAWGLCFPSCNGTIAEGTKVPNPSTCNEFYVCSDVDEDGDFELSIDSLTCPTGTYFDQLTHECVTVPTDGSSYCSPCNPCAVDCTNPGSLQPDPYNCHSYYVCLDNGQSILASCEEGQNFDFEIGNCALEADARCFEACDPCEIYCVEEGRIPDPYDCTAYFYCVPGSGPASFQCLDGEYYNSAVQECQEESSTCENSCIEPTTVTTTTLSAPVTSTTSTTTAPGGGWEKK